MLTFTRAMCCTRGPISSRTNPRVKSIRRLIASRRARSKEGVVVVEGHRLVLDALAAGHRAQTLFYCAEALTRGQHGEMLEKLVQNLPLNVPVEMTQDVLDYISDTVNSQGVAAILQKVEAPLPNVPRLVMALDRINDPGNVGTLLRAAVGAGVDYVLLSEGCADVYGLKALRAGMGAQFRIPTRADMTWAELQRHVQEHKLCLRVADGRGPMRHFDVDWSKPSMLVIGSEADGPRKEALDAASEIVSIPLVEDSADSLNAAVAGAVIVFEARRQLLKRQS
eukprot:Plantae.Rhodophyta-Purpureofilum_apyrenoidigerum.ctg35152.p1 GENE.Plantae.Rhodophyta-Purpureofilum_apyrenoidigerum.ctg35152~~Plantae.Rhodophyta-Purpureofilum_apyrenoidigerum.ctg35152.p1  ORF type:complete len:281 (-),score=35.36 Plantae.Rhodophyta-Purpureofilum_apyrenoidigerum.ctg35152:416-1258(-)